MKALLLILSINVMVFANLGFSEAQLIDMITSTKETIKNLESIDGMDPSLTKQMKSSLRTYENELKQLRASGNASKNDKKINKSIVGKWRNSSGKTEYNFYSGGSGEEIKYDIRGKGSKRITKLKYRTSNGKLIYTVTSQVVVNSNYDKELSTPSGSTKQYSDSYTINSFGLLSLGGDTFSRK